MPTDEELPIAKIDYPHLGADGSATRRDVDDLRARVKVLEAQHENTIDAIRNRVVGHSTRTADESVDAQLLYWQNRMVIDSEREVW